MDHKNWSELADIYAAGALDGDELGRFEAHLSTGCIQCQARLRETGEALAGISVSLQPIAPAESLKTRLLERIDSEKPGLVYIHANDGKWIEAEPGIFAKILNLDTERRRVTALVRMQPGSAYADHRHLGTEEVLVLEGSCYCGGRLLRPGDYHRAEVGSIHLDTRTEEGSLMLITAPLQNERLAT
ncbi:MAG TPA: cupin domain-containing protein [Candidatus Binatia bacterium]|nr:cupin domain-containing protein [Candidatus Binatia bacterium]